MNKYSLSVAVLSLFAGQVLAQATPDKEVNKKDKQETVSQNLTTEDQPTTVIKVVPSSKIKNAKPAKVSSAKPRTARSGGNRSARNPRPSSRPARPGNGRN